MVTHGCRQNLTGTGLVISKTAVMQRVRLTPAATTINHQGEESMEVINRNSIERAAPWVIVFCLVWIGFSFARLL